MTTDSPSTDFIRGIGPLQAVSLVVGSMIGSGIFIVSADIGRQVNAWGPGGLMLVWVLTGLMTVAGALSYAELAGMMPKAGGQYVFLREGLNPLAGFLYGWTLFAVIQTGTIAAVAVAFAKYLGVFFPALTDHLFLPLGSFALPAGLGGQSIALGLSPERVVAILSVLFLTWVNVRGVGLGAGIQTLLTIVKTVALGGLILLGITIFRHADVWAANVAHFWGTAPWSLAMLPVIAAAMVGSLFSSDAWNNVTFAAAEVREPARNLPRALALGTGLVTLLYLLANVAYLHVLPFAGDPAGADALARGMQHAASDRIGAAAAEVMLGSAGALVMAGLIVISTFGCNAGLILSGPRLYWAMAQDKLFFAPAAALHPVHRTPTFGLWAQAVWTSLLCLTGTYNQLLDFVIPAVLVFYFLTIIALFRLRATRPDLPRPVKAFGYPVVPGLYLVALAFVTGAQVLARPLFAATGLIIVAIGVPVYMWWHRGAATTRRDS
ncbi:MAG TPA: amino acid permease [Gemmatimonadales bacterium]|nr:amino acid permease [Gemmatimonadales bacterium]